MKRGERRVVPKAQAKQKSDRRRSVTNFRRILKYGADNFIRNAWLSLAATLIMTITLTIILLSVIANGVLTETVATIREKVDMSIYMVPELSPSTAAEIQSRLNQLENTKEVNYVSSIQARDELIANNRDNDDIKEALKEAKNKTPATFRVKLYNIDDTSELETFVDQDQLVKANINPDFEPSFASSRREAIVRIADTAKFIERVGVVAALASVGVAMLVVFNTIRMAIFNRRDEIYMMRLIGAEPNFIRGPYLVEAMMNGVIAAILAVAICVVGANIIQDSLVDYGVAMSGTLQFLNSFWFLVLAGLAFVGMVIGVISAALAVRKYLSEDYR